LNFLFIFFINLDTFLLKIGINAMTVSYNVLYFIINAIVFKLRPVLFLNGCVFVFSAVCAFYSLHMDLVPKGAGEPAMMRNALVLSFAGLVLQHLVLNVRAMLVEQLAHIKVQVAALQAEVLVQDARKMAIEKAERLNRMSVLEVLSASIAHEINQPVAAAMTYCQAARN
jgi:signal transduction histidine kinase